jgi:multiple antibiotic resistance protein
MDTFLRLLQEFGLNFVPLFVAIDAIGTLPILLPLTKGMSPHERNRVTRLALLTALGLGIGFMIIGKGIFIFLGIKGADFLVAGGLILFILATKEIITGKMINEQDSGGAAMIGAVPLGTPLVVGPAVLTTLLILIEQYAVVMVVIAFIVNLAIVWLLFSQANRIMGFLGKGGSRVISKVIVLFLAAIAIKMIRQGMLEILGAS